MERLDHRLRLILLTFLLSSENDLAGNLSNHIAQMHGASPTVRHLIHYCPNKTLSQTMAKLLSTLRMDGHFTLKAIHG